MQKVKVELMVGAQMPTKGSPEAGAYDLYAADNCVIHAGHRVTIGTGVKLDIPAGYSAKVLPRSGLASKNGITVLNAPGLIDNDYTGEVKVILLNTDEFFPFNVKRGDRIAQLKIERDEPVELVLGAVGKVTYRGEGGLGSTGV